MHKQNYTPTGLKNLLKNAGFVGVKTKLFEFEFNIVAVGKK